MKRNYQKAEGSKNGKKLELSLTGKDILIMRDGMKYQFTVDGKELTGDNKTFLEMEFRDKKSSDEDSEIEDKILPKEAVAVNEAWKVDMAALAGKDLSGDSPFTVDAAKSSATGKLLKAYKKDGKHFGVIEVDMTMAITKLGMGEKAFDLDATSMIKFTFRFDGCVDGSSGSGVMGMSIQMKMAGALKTPDGMEVKLDMNMNAKASRAQVDLTSKK